MNRKSRNTPGQQGFTLLELIVAVSILALIAVFSWRGLDAVVQTRDSLTLAQARIDDLQRSFNRIERDALLAQDIRRVDQGLRLIAAHGAVVEYQFDRGSLWRRVIDAGSGAVDEQQRLVEHVLGWNAEVFRRNPDGVVGWTAVPSDPPASAGPVVSEGTSTPALSAISTATSTATLTLPATRFALPALTGSPAQSAAPQNPAFNPAGETPLQLRHLSGLRISVTLAQGGTVQRLFLLGSGA